MCEIAVLFADVRLADGKWSSSGGYEPCSPSSELTVELLGPRHGCGGGQGANGNNDENELVASGARAERGRGNRGHCSSSSDGENQYAVDAGIGAEPVHVGDQGGPAQGDEPNAQAEQRYEGDHSDWSRDGQKDCDAEGLAGEDGGGGYCQ
jgi:hypothetical protein